MAPKKRWSHYFNSLKQDPERYRLYLDKDKEQKKKLALILPQQTADTECGFSAQNLTKAAHKN